MRAGGGSSVVGCLIAEPLALATSIGCCGFAARKGLPTLTGMDFEMSSDRALVTAVLRLRDPESQFFDSDGHENARGQQRPASYA
jgi:hypothetical protein